MEISWKSVIKFFLVAIGFLVLWQIRPIVFIVLVVVILAAALLPLVAWLGRFKIPRGLAILIIYLFFAGVFALFIYFVIPLVVSQVQVIANNAPEFINRAARIDQLTNLQAAERTLDTLSSNLSKISASFWGAIVSVFGGFLSFLTILVLTFYLLIDSDKITAGLMKLFLPSQREHVKKLIDDVSLKLGRWFRGQLTLMAIVGVVIGLGLYVLGVPFALTLGFAAGLLEIVPFVGPIISALLALLVAIAVGAPAWQLIAIILLFIIVQQLENQILVPKIMQKAIGLSPAVVIVAILIGGSLFGLAGAVLSIPLAAGLSVFISEYLAIRDHLHQGE